MPPLIPPDRSRRRFLLQLGLVLALALAARLGWALSRPADDESLKGLPDQVEYVELARNLLAGKGLFFFDHRFNDNAYAYRMPGYPAFLAACGAKPVVARAAQAAVDASTVLATALLALAFLPRDRARRGAVVAAAIVAVNPPLVFFTGLLLSETLFTAMLAWGMLLLVVGGRGGRLRLDSPDATPRPLVGTLLWLLGGLVLAGSSLVRPSAIPLAVGMGVLAAIAVRPPARSGIATFRPRWPLPVGATMLLLTAAVLLPWAYRNSTAIGKWIWTTTNGGVTAYDGFNPDATGASDQGNLRRLPQLKSMNEVERSAYLSDRASAFVRENPRRAAELAVAKAGRMWSPVPLSAEYGSWTYRAVGLGYTVPLFALVVLGLWRGPVGFAAKAFLLGPALYFTLVHMASVGSLRYRVPVEPPMAVLAAAGLLWVIGLVRPAWTRSDEHRMG